MKFLCYSTKSNAIRPVSYTHLDVYKRQHLILALAHHQFNFRCLLRQNIEKGGENTSSKEKEMDLPYTAKVGQEVTNIIFRPVILLSTPRYKDTLIFLHPKYPPIDINEGWY